MTTAPIIVKAMSDISVRLKVAPPPHWRSGRTVRGMMTHHLLALLPAAIMGIMRFGPEAARVMALSGAVAVLTEAACRRLMGRDIGVDDFTALYAGLLFAFLLPAGAAWWVVAVGAATTIALGRSVFGGFGSNPVCAPLVAWAVCWLSWPAAMDIDLNMAHSLLNYPPDQLKHFGPQALSQFDYVDMLLGSQLGGLGASQALALLAGGAYLLATGWTRAYIPAAFIAGVAVLSGILWLIDPGAHADPLFHLLAGSTVFGAFFLATDTASSPVGRLPQILFGLTAGMLVITIRVYGVHSDGVPFAIMVANLLSPLLDRVRPKPFGGR